MKNAILFFATVGFGCIIISSCDKNNGDTMQTYYGTAIAVGGDSVRSFVMMDANGQPASIGYELGENALNGLPTDTSMGMMGYMFNPLLPSQASATGVNHLEMDWNPYGHPPPGIYTVPHFDFHFYYTTAQQQAMVAPGPDTMPVPLQYLPQDYISSVDAVPNMGVHWFDSTSAEFHGIPFTATFIYGYYRGNFMFIEPMITKAFLETHPDYSAVIKQPQAFQTNGYYATTYKVQFDDTKKVYRIFLSGLIKH